MSIEQRLTLLPTIAKSLGGSKMQRIILHHILPSESEALESWH